MNMLYVNGVQTVMKITLVKFQVKLLHKEAHDKLAAAPRDKFWRSKD